MKKIFLVAVLLTLPFLKAHSEESNADFISQQVSVVKSMLPIKIDPTASFTDIKGDDSSMTYVYTLEMDLSSLAPEQKAAMTNAVTGTICPKTTEVVCATSKVILDRGITINTEYNDKAGNSVGSCSYKSADCNK